MRKILVISLFLFTSLPVKGSTLDSVFLDCVLGEGLPSGLCYFLVEQLASGSYGQVPGQSPDVHRAINLAQRGVADATARRNEAFDKYFAELQKCWAGICDGFDAAKTAYDQAEAALTAASRAATSAVIANTGANYGSPNISAIMATIQQQQALQAARQAEEQRTINALAALLGNGSSFDLLAALLLQ